MVVHAFKPSKREAETGGFLTASGRAGRQAGRKPKQAVHAEVQIDFVALQWSGGTFSACQVKLQ